MAGRGMELTRPAWMTQDAAQAGQPAAVEAQAEPQLDGGGQLVPVGQPSAPDDDQRYTSSSDSEDDEDQTDFPPGPIDPEKCLAGGPGFAGGAAAAPVAFYITSKDSRGARIKEGGAYVVVKVTPGTSAAAAGAEPVEAVVKDNNDGTYTGTYTVAARGDYQLTIEVNGSPIGGSPFPVFFSPPEPASSTAPGSSSDPTAGIAGTAGSKSPDGSGALGLNAEQLAQISAKAAALMPQVSLLGTAAHAAGVVFPVDEDLVTRTLLIGSISPTVTVSQLKQLFGFCGTVLDVTFHANNQYAFVEFAKPEEASAALPMNNMQVADRALKVEMAKTARDATPQGVANPFTAVQMQNLQQFQIAQMQTSSLAAQVAQMRAMARLNPGSVVTGVPQNSASQRAAALSAAAALSKRLAALGGDKPRDTHIPVRIVPDRSGGKRRRSVSPTIRYRKDAERTRSRERERERSRGRERSSRERDRDHSRARDRDGHRSSGRDRERERDRDRSSKPSGSSRRTDRDDSRERRSRRHVRSASPRDAPRDRDERSRKPHDSGRDGSTREREREHDRERSRDHGKDRGDRGRDRDDRRDRDGDRDRDRDRKERARDPDVGRSRGEADRHRSRDRHRATDAEAEPEQVPAGEANGDAPAVDAEGAAPDTQQSQRELEQTLRRQLEERQQARQRDNDVPAADGSAGDAIDAANARPGADASTADPMEVDHAGHADPAELQPAGVAADGGEEGGEGAEPGGEGEADERGDREERRRSKHHRRERDGEGHRERHHKKKHRRERE